MAFKELCNLYYRALARYEYAHSEIRLGLTLVIINTINKKGYDAPLHIAAKYNHITNNKLFITK
ncbi:MAG: hypothetical protein AB8U25_05110 [Rickettsiales endosymbiont of Dermacentor nuttalli]